ncbi:MAG: LysR family transcriptional regulator [Desulfobacterales bacterium]|nr:LysR family transcriptional regulator [Desulfobacterales bacterium]
MKKIDRLDISQLRIFQALLRERNASRVASQVGLTQQAVSDQLRKLRDIFEDRLFIRKSNGMIPTPLAEVLGKKVDTVLKDIERLLSPDSFDPALVKATYVISASDYAQQIVLPDLLKIIRQTAPGLKIIIRDLDIDNLDELMVECRVNLAIAFPDFIPSSYSYITLFTEHHVCIASKKSSLLKRKLKLKEIASHPQIIASPVRANFKGSIDAWLQKSGITRNVVVSAPCFSSVPSYIEATDAIAFLPSRVFLNDNLTTVELAENPPVFDIIAAWHSRSDQDPLHNWIVGLLKQQYNIP